MDDLAINTPISPQPTTAANKRRAFEQPSPRSPSSSPRRSPPKVGSRTSRSSSASISTSSRAACCCPPSAGVCLPAIVTEEPIRSRSPAARAFVLTVSRTAKSRPPSRTSPDAPSLTWDAVIIEKATAAKRAAPKPPAKLKSAPAPTADAKPRSGVAELTRASLKRKQAGGPSHV